MPQTAMSLGARYQSPKFWSIGGNLNYFNDIYLDPNPDRRTAEAVDGLITDDPELVDQPKLDDGITLDLYATKSWMYHKKYRIAQCQCEQRAGQAGPHHRRLRAAPLRYPEPGTIPARYGYMYGRTFFLRDAHLQFLNLTPSPSPVWRGERILEPKKHMHRMSLHSSRSSLSPCPSSHCSAPATRTSIAAQADHAVGSVVTIAELKAMFTLNPVHFDTAMSVYAVVNSDENDGNFYKNVYVQDATGGLCRPLN